MNNRAKTLEIRADCTGNEWKDYVNRHEFCEIFVKKYAGGNILCKWIGPHNAFSRESVIVRALGVI